MQTTGNMPRLLQGGSPNQADNKSAKPMQMECANCGKKMSPAKMQLHLAKSSSNEPDCSGMI